jgi:hypothetical protein
MPSKVIKCKTSLRKVKKSPHLSAAFSHQFEIGLVVLNEILPPRPGFNCFDLQSEICYQRLNQFIQTDLYMSTNRLPFAKPVQDIISPDTNPSLT